MLLLLPVRRRFSMEKFLIAARVTWLGGVRRALSAFGRDVSSASVGEVRKLRSIADIVARTGRDPAPK